MCAEESASGPAEELASLAKGRKRSSSKTRHRGAQRCIQALGTYAPGALPSGVRASWTDKLAELYKNDPDAGIHGAAEWTLRQWKEDGRLTSIDEELKSLKDPGDRRLARQS